MMTNATSIRIIPATKSLINPMDPGQIPRKRVAAYARVSTDTDEQLTSYEAQVDFYTKQIKGNSQWDFIEVYTDEGISATSTKKRDGFNRMIQDALRGNIDLILTKSVSRFARNTVDTLTTVRKLKEKGVEVYFEKENIYTLDSKGELLITIMSSLAQEESRSISENVTWGQRKRFADGKVSLPYRQFLGYEKGEDGLPKIVEEEAKIIRMIYRMFLDGGNYSSIARELIKQGIPTPAKRKFWRDATIRSILTNEKYKGDAILQKTFTVDFLTKKKKVNEGEVPKYYVENSHPAIIRPEVFNMVQHEIDQRKRKVGYKTNSHIFSGKIVCGECGGFYGPKLWHSTSKYKKTVWQCNRKFHNETKCSTLHVHENEIKKAFVEMFNSMIENKEKVLEEYNKHLKSLNNTSQIDADEKRLKEDLSIVDGRLDELIHLNITTSKDRMKYEEKHAELIEQQKELSDEIESLKDEKRRRISQRENIKVISQIIKENENIISEFDEALWKGLVEKIIITGQGLFTIKLKDNILTKY